MRVKNTHYPTLYFPFPGIVEVSVEELSGLGLGVPVLMSSLPGCCGCWPDHWPALKEQKATTTKVSARSRYFARGAFLCDLDLGEVPSSRGSSDVESLSYCRFGMGERGQAVRTPDRSQNPGKDSYPSQPGTWRLSSLLRGASDTPTSGGLSRNGSGAPSLGCTGNLGSFFWRRTLRFLECLSFRNRRGFGFTRPSPWTPLLPVT